jgi:hypothetical protein
LGECWFSILAQNAMPDIDHDQDNEDDEDVDDELHVDARVPPGDAAGEDAADEDTQRQVIAGGAEDIVEDGGDVAVEVYHDNMLDRLF